MTDEEIIIEAYKRYPPGTIFNSKGGNCGVEIFKNTTLCWKGSFIKVNKANKNGSVYHKINGWATIIKQGIPKSDIINSYNIY